MKTDHIKLTKTAKWLQVAFRVCSLAMFALTLFILILFLMYAFTSDIQQTTDNLSSNNIHIVNVNFAGTQITAADLSRPIILSIIFWWMLSPALFTAILHISALICKETKTMWTPFTLSNVRLTRILKTLVIATTSYQIFGNWVVITLISRSLAPVSVFLWNITHIVLAVIFILLAHLLVHIFAHGSVLQAESNETL